MSRKYPAGHSTDSARFASQPESKTVVETLAGAGELLLLSVSFPRGFPASFTLLNSDLVSLLYDFFFFPSPVIFTELSCGVVCFSGSGLSHCNKLL